MSASPQMMQAMLAQSLAQPQAQQSQAPFSLPPSPAIGAAQQLAQKAMLVRALSQQPQGQPYA